MILLRFTVQDSTYWFIYSLKRIREGTPPFKGHNLWSEICSYNLCCEHFFCGKTLCFFRIKKPHFNLFLPITSLFLNFIYSSNYLYAKPRIDTRLYPTTSLKVGPGNHKILKCSAIELIEFTNLLLDTWFSHSHKPK